MVRPGGLALALLLLAACGREPAERREHWNVLVFVPDTTRADHLGVNGYERKVTPHLDAFAADATNFTQAITAAPRTWQSFTTIMTGLYPPHHNLRFQSDHALSPDIPTMATVLGGAGYETRAFDRLPFLRRMLDDRGFDAFDDGVVSTDASLGDHVWEWIAEKRERPFFAFVRLNGPHWPYEATPEELADLDPCEGKDHGFNGDWAELGFGIPGPEGATLASAQKYVRRIFQVPGDQVRRHTIAHYDAELRRTDAVFGTLIGHLRDAGLLERTLIVMTSDHGESFGEHDYMQHGSRVDDAVMHVPLIIRLPDAFGPRATGRTVTQQVRTVDIFPTILDVTGVPAPPRLDGRSLLPAMLGEKLPEAWAYGETCKDFVGVDPQLFVEGVAGKHRMLRADPWKLVYVPTPTGASRRLYDLRTDPGEERDLSALEPEKVDELQAFLDTIRLKDTRATGAANTEAPEITPEMEEKLRALGYL